jgi:hypothetical protein
MATTAGWTAVQLVNLVDRTRDALDEASAALGAELVADVHEGAEIVLSAERIAPVKEALERTVELAEQLTRLAEALPDRDVTFDLADVRHGAAEDLGAGPLDSERALLAAGMLDLGQGCSALSEALASTDAPVQWDHVTVEEMIGRFRGSDPFVVRGLAERAGLEVRTAFSRASPDELARLARALERLASELPGG